MALHLVAISLDGSRGPALARGHVGLKDLFQRGNGQDGLARLLGILAAGGALDDRPCPLARLAGQHLADPGDDHARRWRWSEAQKR